MIPSTLAAEVTDALEDFLSTGFGPSNPALSGVVEQFLADTDNLFKGPYLSVDLPFQHAPEGGEFTEAAARELPPMVQEVLGELPEETAFAGRGSWRDTPPDFAQVFLALPLAAVDPPDPDQLVVVLHLDDSAPSADQDYRREWNGVLRLYNLLQFLPSSLWTTAMGVWRDLYPDFAIPEPVVTAPYSTEWADAMSLADVELRSTMEVLAARGVLPPEGGFELIDAVGEVSAEAELAWEAERGVVLLADQEGQRFAEAGWRTFQANAPDLVEAISAWWTEVRS